MRIETPRTANQTRARTAAAICAAHTMPPISEDLAAVWQSAFEQRHSEPEVVAVVPKKKKAPAKRKSRKLEERTVDFLNGFCAGGIMVLFIVGGCLLALGVL